MTDVPKFVYVARIIACGCVVGVATDRADAATAVAVAEFISEGLRAQSVDFETYRNEVCKEQGFMCCVHEEEQR